RSLWIDVSERARSPVVRMEASLGAAEAAYELGDLTGARAFIEGARALPAGDPVLGAAADALESTVLRWAGRVLDETGPQARRALAAMREASGAAGGVERLDGRARRTYL